MKNHRRSVVHKLVENGYKPERRTKHGEIYSHPERPSALVPREFLKPALADNFVRRLGL